MKKLSVNTLALRSIKAGKKRYTGLIIGIVLAMMFSSSIVFFMFSASETANEEKAKQQGKQSSIVYCEELGENEYQKAVDKKLINDFGFAHTLGYAYADETQKRLGANLCWLDDKAKDISYQVVTEGELPKAENEIAAEESALIRLGYKDAKIGDNISLLLDVQNGKNYFKTVIKEYKLVGILADKKSNIEDRYVESDKYDTLIPAFFVAENTQTELGGKEKLTAYISADFSRPDSELNFKNYIYELSENYQINSANYSAHTFASFEDLFSGGSYFFLVILVLIFASCVAIINAFNTNLKERKKQIGMLRAVGTTRRQIIKIFGREAFIITLICVPVSIALSYGIVHILLSVISDEAIITKSMIALPVAAVFNIIVVMAAALIPLFAASRISPMQAIRNIDNTRKAKRKKIKTKMQFDVPSHIAKRNLKLYNGGFAAVSIMLGATIILSCFGLSVISNIKDDMRSLSFDYRFDAQNSAGISEIDKQDILSMPYFSEISGKKSINVTIGYEKVDNFFRVINYGAFASPDGNSPSTTDELIYNIKNNPTDEYYNEIKTQLGIDSEYVDTNMVALEGKSLEKLCTAVNKGKVDFSKLDAGEEVILVVPEKVELLGYAYNGGYAISTNTNEKVGTRQVKCRSILTADNPYHVGDEIPVYIKQYTYDEKTGTNIITIKNSKTVKVGAIVSQDEANEFGIITSKSGMESFEQGVGYVSLDIYAVDEIDEESDLEIMDALEAYSQKYNAYVESKYSYNQIQKNEYYSLWATMISIIIISFVICASVINNSLSARIRENKRVIGTLRAVGASQSDLVKSYVIQMLHMFSRGIVIGFGIYLTVFLIAKVIKYYYPISNLLLTFNPWMAIGMIALLFLICSINLWLKVRKETKNSIVENIREL